MPLSFDAARLKAGNKEKPYVPLSERANSGNSGLLANLPGSYTAATTAANKQQPPPKASAAPVAGKQNIFVGLSTSLNEYQQTLVKQKKREIADEYVIEFAPTTIGGSQVKRPGAQDISTAPMQTPDSAAKIDSKTNTVSKPGRTWPVKAGTQIIKVIDDVMRNSSYILDQQNVEITTATDPATGVQTQKINPRASTGNMQWYKISIAVTQLGYDNIIRDHAFRMSFIVTPYAIAQMTSQYFPDSRYRGVHKAYRYWFTGENTQILSYEQNYNNAYRLFLSGIGPDAQQRVTTDFRDQNRYIYMPTSPDQATGAKNYANEPGNNGASFLYDPSSLSTVRLRIVGDPAWLQQGEVATGVTARTFDFKPFNLDGSINYDSQAVMFNVAFNTPTDYDLSTGIMDVNAPIRGRPPQELYTFTAIQCKSIFSKGKFEQELEGRLLIEKNLKASATGGRAAASQQSTGSRDSGRITDAFRGAEIRDETGAVSNLRLNEYGDLYDPTGTGLPSPQPAPPPGAPGSSGDIVAPGDEDAQQVAFERTPPPATADQLAEAYGGTRPTSEEIEARNAYIAAGAPSTGPLREAYVSAGAAFNNRAAAAGPTASTQAPQEMNRET
jgi:ribosomal protein L22